MIRSILGCCRDPGSRRRLRSPSRSEDLNLVEDALKQLFGRILATLAETDNFSQADSPSVFIVYAHDNDILGSANASYVKRLIQSLSNIRSQTLSDRSPLPLWSTREGGFDAIRNIVANQFCLLPSNSAMRNTDIVECVEKVIVCGSTILEQYYKNPFTSPYVDAIEKVYAEAQSRHLERNALFEKMKMTVEQHCRTDGFHHVLTELAFLKIRISQTKADNDLIPIALDRNEIRYLPFFPKNTDLFFPLKSPDIYSEHLLFFKLLVQIYPKQHFLITTFQECYTEVNTELKSASETAKQQVDEIIARNMAKAQNRIGNFHIATYRNMGSRGLEAAPFLLPFQRNQHFSGRSEQLQKIGSHLTAEGGEKYAVYGLGGCGKSALAIEFAYHLRDKYSTCAVFWVPALSTQTFEQAYQDIGKALKIPQVVGNHLNDSVDIKGLVKERLNDRDSGPWLMIVDNIDDERVLFDGLHAQQTMRLIDYLPQNHGSIIFTTRTMKIAIDLAGSNIIKMPELDEEEAKELLRRRVVEKGILDNETVMHEFLKALTYLPLAIVQAVAYINKNKIDLTKYLDLFNKTRPNSTNLLKQDFQDDSRYQDAKNAVATTWHISFGQIREDDKLAADYLAFMACLKPENIPESILPIESDIAMTSALGTLKAYNFVTERTGSGGASDSIETYDMHQLVHLATEDWLRFCGQWDDWIDRALQRLIEVIPYGDHETRHSWSRYLAHGEHIADLAGLQEAHANAKISLLERIGFCHQRLGQYIAAEARHREVLVFREKLLGKERPETLISMNHVAIALRHQGKHDEAEQMYRETLALQEKVLGKEHPDTLTSMNNLALVLSYQGKYDEAEQMYRETLALQEKVLGKEHPGTLRSMNNLAFVLSYQGKYDEAEQMYRETLALQEKVVGKEHPDTLRSMNNLALVLSK